MTEDQTLALVASLMMLVLVGSSLAVRRLPFRQLGVIALAWIAIFVVALTLVSLWLAWRGPEEIRLVPEERTEERTTMRPDDPIILHNVYYQTERAVTGRG